jgi:hypothetical protein
MAIRDWDPKSYAGVTSPRARRVTVLISPEREDWHLSLIADNETLVKYRVRRDLLGEVISTITNNWNTNETNGSLVIGWSLVAQGSVGPGHGPPPGPPGIPVLDAANVQLHFATLALGEIANRIEGY